VGVLLACALGCASNDPPGPTAGVNRGGYYGGTIHSNSWPETYGRSGPYAIGRPAYRY
jgi:hypothetical protein